MTRIILASQSPRRRQLLLQINLRFEVIPAHTDEDHNGITDPETLVCELAHEKATEVVQRVIDEKGRIESAVRHTSTLVIGADTIVVLDGKILGKPVDETDARRLLKQLSGRTHSVYTGVSLVIFEQESRNSTGPGISPYTLKSRTFFERTDVTFSELSDAEIAGYVAGGSPMDKAGAYGIQDDLGALFVERIEGDYYNVVGFPLNRFYREMKTFVEGVVSVRHETGDRRHETSSC
ncbi:MAG: Maf family protein [Rhodothermaceae bacterium]|nr:Maf family protein [Rhodothermaceae bacterium]